MKGTKKQKIIFLKGLPASGKSTYAKKLVDENPGKYKRVNKDDLRAMLDNGHYTKGNEKFVIRVRDFLMQEALMSDYDVIVDDTNFHPAHLKSIQDIAVRHEAEVEEVFFNVPFWACIERDSKRGDKSVGAKVIMQMYNDYLKPEPMKQDANLKPAVIVDIDGTVAKMNGRAPYEWEKVDTDVPKTEIIELVEKLGESHQIIFMSGRDGSCQDKTLAWLTAHTDLDGFHLFMRNRGDTRKDFDVKRELFDTHVRDKYNVKLVLDDRDQVVHLWRSLGLTCLQVDYGNF